MKTYKNLWNTFLSDDNIREAIMNASKGKRNRALMKDIYNNPDYWIPIIRGWALNFENAPHVPVQIYDGIKHKKRQIIVPSNKEQVIHHMICNVLKPIFMKGMYEHSYGSIPKRGGTMARNRIERWIKHDKHNTKYVLKMDIHKFFDSVSHTILKRKLKEKIRDERLLEILFTVIDITKVGLPLGFYTSQWLANWYLQDLDHFIKETLGAKYYMRYMDDMVIFGANKRKLHKLRIAIEEFLYRELDLELNPKWQVYRFICIKHDKERGRDLDFMGFRFYYNRVILRKSIMLRCSRKAKNIFRKGECTVYDARQILSYIGWLDYTDTYRFYLKYVKPFISIQRCKRKVSADDKRKARERSLFNGLEVRRECS